jgi:hypothetical protein
LRTLFLFIILCLFIFDCGGLDRDNPLDPKNPNSSVEHAILVELFVNDSTGFEYCNYALDALERLAQREEFKDNLFVVEYHLTNRTHNWNDSYALDEFNQRYYQYVPNLNERGIPDAMFNGLIKRVQGASLENIDNRYSEAADQFLGQNCYFRIEAEKQISNNFMQLEVTVARYGKSNDNNIDLHAILYEDIGTARHHYMARKILQKQTIPKIKHGEIKSFHFSEQLPQVNNINNLFVLVFLQDQQGAKKEVLQVAKF